MTQHSDTKTLQLWPGGTSITYAGDYSDSAPPPTVYPSGWADTATPSRPATPEEHRAIRINERAAMYLERDVLAYMSSLVDDLRKLQYEQRGDLAEGFSDENIANLTPDPSDWDLKTCEDWIEERGIDTPDAHGMDEDDWLEALQDIVRDHAEPAEIYEWWLVSDWLGHRLAEIGECVLDSGYGVFWGRTCTGQAIIMDGTLQAVAATFEAHSAERGTR